jgi:hypothetical protein
MTMTGNDEDRPAEKPSADNGQRRAVAPRRSCYQPPRLIEWGTLIQLTSGGMGPEDDFDPASSKAV